MNVLIFTGNMLMNGVNKLIVMFVACLLSACAVNGKHTYIDGKCISCWNNPITQEPLNHSNSGANNYEVLTWHELMLEGLDVSKNNLDIYAEDYLRYQYGNKVLSMQGNEIAYQRNLNKAVGDLSNAINTRNLKPEYQVTVPSKLDSYDFENQEFPVLQADSFILLSRNNISVLPKEIVINISNFYALPNLKMSDSEAERFLKKRRNSRGLYVRYILENFEMDMPGSFSARVKEIQFIDEKPSIVTKVDKDKFQPMKVVNILKIKGSE